MFRPVCPDCRECRSLRIDVAAFQPDRSQRRAWRAGAHLEVRVAPPSADSARLDLYHRYHAAREADRGWPATSRSVEEYAFDFVENELPAREISLWEAGKLVAVVLTELASESVSGIYHYYEPEHALPLGTIGMLHTLELARRLGRAWAYFGYYVAACPSLAYKARFRPCELLGDTARWQAEQGFDRDA